MKAAKILELDEVTFIEPLFSALRDPLFTDLITQSLADEGRLLLDEHEDPIAVAFHEPSGWIAASFLCRKPNRAIIERFEEVSGEIFQEDRAAWASAVREYFSIALMQDTSPAVEDLNPIRKSILSEVITNVWGKGSGETCLDCGCGSGVGSLVLREMGYLPLSYDNDPSLLARGLAEKRLLPDETMCIDATAASAYLDPVPRGIGIMMGEINSFSEEMWHAIVGDFLSIAGECLITVGTQDEARLVRDWGDDIQRPVEIRES
ncbi:MAG: hypothetical protein WC391_09045, partial [Methanoregula sp.]